MNNQNIKLTPKPRKYRLIIGVALFVAVIVGVIIWLVKKRYNPETCTDPKNPVPGGVTYLLNKDGDCSDNVHTCNTFVGYDLTPVGGSCVISNKFTQVDPPTKCIHDTSNAHIDEAYCSVDNWYSSNKDAKTPANMNVCKNNISTKCKRLNSDCKPEYHFFCGTDDDVDCDTLWPQKAKCPK